MSKRILALLAGAACLSVSAAFPQEMQTSLRSLLVEYRCQTVDRLERIYEFGDHSSHRDRYIAVTVPEHRHGYVQCMFVERRSQMLCEASSGFYYDKEGEPRTFRHPPEVPAALSRLGFSTDDSQGNYQMMFDVGVRPNFNKIADLILKSLHDGYGARAETRLRFNAPFAKRAPSSCVPVS
jgi:hypothetical protein